LQMPLGALVDLLREKQKTGSARFRIFPLSAVTAVLGVFVTFFGALLHPAVLGLGNALFHVGGGIGTIDEDRQKGLKGQALGIFVAPGAMGLFLGTVIGKTTAEEKFGLGLLAILFAFMIATLILYMGLFLSERKRLLAEKEKLGRLDAALAAAAVADPEKLEAIVSEAVGEKSTEAAGRDARPFTGMAFAAALLCFFVVVLRSHVGMSIGFSWKQGVGIGVLATAMVVGGKMLGGILSAHIGQKITVIASLALAALCYAFSDNIVFGLLALLFFNMTMPITLQLLVDRFPHLAGFGFGLLTFALFLGFLPTWFRLQNPLSGNIMGLVLSLVSLVMLFGAVLLLDREAKQS
ncbi:MAG: hypothetical protein IKR59_00085, partial [Lachnospiraceae bacterium]|nr:hypothetical protein [Lachnospiraceae bacterium]